MESSPKPRLRVVAAALFDEQGRVLIAERPAGKHMAGWWEFPGGKVAAGESDAQALVRELREELGVDARPDSSDHDADPRIPGPRGRPGVVARVCRRRAAGLDGQQLKWVACDSLDAERLLPADRPFIEALQLLSSAATF